MFWKLNRFVSICMKCSFLSIIVSGWLRQLIKLYFRAAWNKDSFQKSYSADRGSKRPTKSPTNFKMKSIFIFLFVLNFSLLAPKRSAVGLSTHFVLIRTIKVDKIISAWQSVNSVPSRQVSPNLRLEWCACVRMDRTQLRKLFNWTQRYINFE